MQPAKSQTETCNSSYISETLRRWRSLEYFDVVVRDSGAIGKCYVLPIRSENCPESAFRDCAIKIDLRYTTDLQAAAILSAAGSACTETFYLDPQS